MFKRLKRIEKYQQVLIALNNKSYASLRLFKESLENLEDKIDNIECDIESLSEKIDGFNSPQPPIIQDIKEPLEPPRSISTAPSVEKEKSDFNPVKDQIDRNQGYGFLSR